MFFISKKIQIIITNILGILVGYFLYQTQALSGEQIIICMGLWALGINFLFFRNGFLKLLSLPGILGVCFFFALGVLPLYKDGPDEKSFARTQKTEYLFLGNPKNVEIKESGEYGAQNISPTKNDQYLFLIESDSRTITFNEKTNNPDENNKLLIKFPNNTLYIMYPGSKIHIQKNGNTYNITKEYGKNEYYLPNKNDEVFIKNSNNEEQKNKSDFSLGYMVDSYEKAKQKHIIDQAGGFIIMEPMYQHFSKKILDIAFRFRPEIYSKNITNYQTYKELLGRKENNKTYETDASWRIPVFEQIKKGHQETRVLQ